MARPRRTHCKKGHPMVGDNVIVKRLMTGEVSRLQCRACLDKPIRTHCKRGHAFIPENIRYTKRGKGSSSVCRQCKVCHETKSAAWRAANKERYRIYHRNWMRLFRDKKGLYGAIKDNGREIAQAVFD